MASALFIQPKASSIRLRMRLAGDIAGMPRGRGGGVLHQPATEPKDVTEAMQPLKLGMRYRRGYNEGLGMHILYIIIIGFIAGLIARFIAPGPNNPSGFILTCILGIVGAFVATYLGQLLGWYRQDQGAGLIGAVIGAVIVLFVWHLVFGRNTSAVDGPGPRRWL